MTPEQTEALFEEVIALLQESRMEARALRQMLADHKVVSEEELEMRMEAIKMEEALELKVELYRRAFEKALRDGPVQ